MALESGPLSSTEFAAVGKKAVLFCHVTTQIEGRPNDDLFSVKGYRGWPSIAVMDAEGEIVMREVGRSVKAMDEAITASTDYQTLKTRIAEGAKGLEAKMFIAELRLGKVDGEEAATKAAGFKFAGEEKKLVDGILFEMQFDAWLDEARGGRMPPKDFFAKVYKAYTEGKRPPDGSEADSMFWQFLLQGADDAADPKAFAAAAAKQLDMMKQELDERLQAVRRKSESKSESKAEKK